MKIKDVRDWATPAAVLASAMIVAAALWVTRPGIIETEVIMPASEKTTASDASDQASEETVAELRAVKAELAGVRCELKRANQIAASPYPSAWTANC